MRLAFTNFIGTDQLQTFDAVIFPALLQGEERWLLPGIRHDNQLPCVAKRNVVLRAEFVRQPIAFYAQSSLQRVLRIINARVIYTTVARAGGHAEFRELLDKKNVLPAR